MLGETYDHRLVAAELFWFYLKLSSLGPPRIQRVAVRLMWNSNDNPIFDRPWCNFINIYAFLKLAEDPNRSEKDILKEFVKEYYSPSARQAAIDLYKYSMEFQRTMYYLKDVYLGDHSRVQDDDADGNLEEIQDQGFLKTPSDFKTRRNEINDAYAKAIALIDRLGKDVPGDWINGLKDGVQVEQYVALSTTDKMEAIFLKKQNAPDANRSAALSDLRQRMTDRARKWKAWHPESYKTMQPGEMFAPLGGKETKIPMRIESPFPTFPRRWPIRSRGSFQNATWTRSSGTMSMSVTRSISIPPMDGKGC